MKIEMKKIGLDALKRLYTINSKSGNEDDIRDVIIELAASVAPEAKVDIDKRGNVMIVKGKGKPYPCVLAHMDEVHRPVPDIRIIETGNFLFGWSDNRRSTVGIGADDKNGIYVCLRALEDLQSVKCIFTVGEEIGGVGSNAIDIDRWLTNVRYVIMCDRRNGSDFITTINGTPLASSEFKKAALEIIGQRGYKKDHGMFTDVYVLKTRGLDVSTCNMSCGYYHPHAENECTNIAELQNCVDAVIEMCTKMTGVYKHKYEKSKYKTYDEMSNYRYKGLGFGRALPANRQSIDLDIKYPRDEYYGTSRFDCSTCTEMNCWNCRKFVEGY